MDHGTPPLKAVRQAHVSILIFTSLKSTLILMETKQTTITIRFNLKYLAPNNIAKYGVIVQEYSDDDPKCKYYTVCYSYKDLNNSVKYHLSLLSVKSGSEAGVKNVDCELTLHRQLVDPEDGEPGEGGYSHIWSI